MSQTIIDLSGYSIMWMMVMFDLPTDTRKERTAATKFRNLLLDNGFEMAQFSVYMRFTGTKEQSQKYINVIKNNAPPTGDICLLFFTDKQFSDIIHIKNLKEDKLSEKPEQFLLF